MATLRPTTDPGVTLRPVHNRDLEFLFRVYASARADATPMPTDRSTGRNDESLRQKFDAQHAYYQFNDPHARRDVIVRDGNNIGRLYVDRMADEMRIADGFVRDPVAPLGAMEGRPRIDAVLHARPDRVAAGRNLEWQIREAP